MTFCWAVLKTSSDGSKAIQDAFCAIKSICATVMTARLLSLWLVISCLCQHGHCLYYRVHILLHSCLSCPARVKTSTEDGCATSSPSHYLYFPLFICCIWHRGDRHLCFTCGLLFKEAKALLCEWFCKKRIISLQIQWKDSKSLGVEFQTPEGSCRKTCALLKDIQGIRQLCQRA